ncbi:hypothetical protein ACGFJ5_23695 [Micromonospora echinaurantiaca]|uniref:hypothetical protein n=1 Tax=Micromonospora echinaurantiaca TaxID=47857 RepID=UPI00371AD177
MDEMPLAAGDGVGAPGDHYRKHQEPVLQPPTEPTSVASGDVDDDDDWLPV